MADPLPAPEPEPTAILYDLLERGDVRRAREEFLHLPRSAFSDEEYRALKRVLSPPRITDSPFQDHDRSAEYRWLIENASQYAGRWVAVDEHGLVADAASLGGVLQRLDQMDLATEPLIHRL